MSKGFGRNTHPGGIEHMKSKNCQILLLLTLILFCLTPNAYAAEITDRNGRVTAGINLRAAPGLSGKVITGLDAGTVVVVTGKQAAWYQIAYEDETYGYRGWVYGKYVELLAAPAAPPVASTVPKEAPQPLPVILQPPLPAQPLPSDVAAGDHNKLPTKMPANTIELIQADAQPEPAAAVQIADGTAATDGPASSTKAALAPATPQPVGIRAQTNVKPITASAKSTYAGPGPGHLLSLLLKIASVFLSCLALLISYRTFQIVTATSRTT